MTREEAIEMLKKDKEQRGNCFISDALDMAIKALEQESCGDAISRQTVDELSKALVHTTRDKADFLCNFWEGLRKLPPVIPQPKTGHWINKSKQSSCGVNFIHIECSECREPSGLNNIYARYCPWCGAKMIES